MSTDLTTVQILDGLRTVRTVLAPDLNDEELRLFAMVANRSGLDPFAKQIYAVKRKGRVTFQTGIDGYRSIAARTGLYDGQDEPEYGPVCGCDQKPVGHPEYATVRVYRKGVGRAIAATAHWHEYKPEPGQSGSGDAMWVRMPRVMIGKVAESLALRKAFPYDPENRLGIGSDVYTADEMAQAESRAPVAKPTLAEKIAEKRATIVVPPSGMTPEDLERWKAARPADQGHDDEPPDLVEAKPKPKKPAGPTVVEFAPAEDDPAPEPVPVAPGQFTFSNTVPTMSPTVFRALLKTNRIAPDYALAEARSNWPDFTWDTATEEQLSELADFLLVTKDS